MSSRPPLQSLTSRRLNSKCDNGELARSRHSAAMLQHALPVGVRLIRDVHVSDNLIGSHEQVISIIVGWTLSLLCRSTGRSFRGSVASNLSTLCVSWSPGLCCPTLSHQYVSALLAIKIHHTRRTCSHSLHPERMGAHQLPRLQSHALCERRLTICRHMRS